MSVPTPDCILFKSSCMVGRSERDAQESIHDGKKSSQTAAYNCTADMHGGVHDAG